MENFWVPLRTTLGHLWDNIRTTFRQLWDNLKTSLGLILEHYEAFSGSHIDYCRRVPLPCGQHVAIYHILVFTYRWAGLLTCTPYGYLCLVFVSLWLWLLSTFTENGNSRIICWFPSFGRCHWTIPSFLIPIIDNNKNLFRYFRPLAFIIGWGVFCGCVTQ